VRLVRASAIARQLAPSVVVRVVLVVALGAGASVGCKGDPVKCEAACRNYGTLVYQRNAEAAVAAEPPETRDALRKRLAGKFNSDLENGVDMCVSQCRSANKEDDIECMIAAKTADQALACFE
jgi:hypothetical protein